MPNVLGPTDPTFSGFYHKAKTLVHYLVVISHVGPVLYAAKGLVRKLFFFPQRNFIMA